MQLWPPLDGIHEQLEKLIEIVLQLSTVLQDHVTGEIFNTQPRNIA